MLRRAELPFGRRAGERSAVGPVALLEADDVEPGIGEPARDHAAGRAGADDQNIGRFVSELSRRKQLDNTLILFLQDNGGCQEVIGRQGQMTRPEKPTLPLIAADATLEKNPDIARRFVAATLRGIEFTRANPRAAVESMAKLVPGIEVVRETAAAEIASYLIFESEVAKRLPVGSFDPAQLRRTWETVAEAQQLDARATNPESFVSRDFLPKR